jgi:hypothetical protein
MADPQNPERAGSDNFWRSTVTRLCLQVWRKFEKHCGAKEGGTPNVSPS